MQAGSDRLTQVFEAERARLIGVAYRVLGSQAEAEDAVQEAWLRASRADSASVANLPAWLTTIVARVCLDVLRARKGRPEELVADDPREDLSSSEPGPEQEAVLADSLGLALFVVLEMLSPAERVAFVLHDMFDVPFEEIASIVGRSPEAARQLASRARRRVQGASPTRQPDLENRRRIVRAFLAASRSGEIEELVRLLDPEIVLRADAVAVAMAAARKYELGARPQTHGARAVAQAFAGRANAAQEALIDGVPGLVWLVTGVPRVAFRFAFDGDLIIGIDLVADQEALARLRIETLSA